MKKGDMYNVQPPHTRTRRCLAGRTSAAEKIGTAANDPNSEA